jgi:hypothetical protein
MKSAPKNKSHNSAGGESSKNPEDYDTYKDPVTAMLTMATFAASITFTVVLAPRNSDQPTPGLTELAYANSLLFGGMVGCVLIITTIQLYKVSVQQDEKWKDTIGSVSKEEFRELRESHKTFRHRWLVDIQSPWSFKISHHEWIIAAEVAFVAIILFAAFFLMLYASRLFLKYDGPFILGSTIYLVLGIAAFTFWFYSLLVDNTLDVMEEIVSTSGVGKKNIEDGKKEIEEGMKILVGKMEDLEEKIEKNKGMFKEEVMTA